jgi:hypothetical protein
VKKTTLLLIWAEKAPLTREKQHNLLNKLKLSLLIRMSELKIKPIACQAVDYPKIFKKKMNMMTKEETPRESVEPIGKRAKKISIMLKKLHVVMSTWPELMVE